MEASGDNLAHHLLQESLPVGFSKFLCLSEVSPWVEFINLLRVHCFNYHHDALYQLIIVFCYHHSTLINLHIIHPRSCVWKKWISILKCPARAWTSIPLEPAARSTLAYLTSNILLGIQQIFSIYPQQCITNKINPGRQDEQRNKCWLDTM